ncbi:hypothetical protein KR222_002695, partial [Zaprionus bogoriensis]
SNHFLTFQMDINNQIENIISDIDLNIKTQEKITQLKEKELQLLQKQKELANQIQQQQILAQRLIAENHRKEQELKAQELKAQELQNQNEYRQEQLTKPIEQYDHKESSNVSKTIDLRKIFTPANDAPQILPKNRKLYASSAFYSPTLHPTMEDQVELARRISHSLSDISNQTSKGQSMYVNRKKRSVKWVHEGWEEEEIQPKALYKENVEEKLQTELTKLEKLPLRLIMNPRGQMRDYNSLKESINIETGLLSPDNCAELITALQLHKGRDYKPYKGKPTGSPNLLPAYSDTGKHRVQLNIHQDNLIEKYAKPGVQVIKSPWEAALQTGSASSAFVDDLRYTSLTPIAAGTSPVNLHNDVIDYPVSLQSDISPTCSRTSYNIDNKQDAYLNVSFPGFIHLISYSSFLLKKPKNPQRELAYKPSVAQGWGGRNVELPKGLYVPKEISLASYGPPPVQAGIDQPLYGHKDSSNVDFTCDNPTLDSSTLRGFPIAQGSCGLYGTVTPKQQFYGPANYQKAPIIPQQAVPHINFNPSPLSHDKLSKFEEPHPKNVQPRLLRCSKPSGFGGVSNTSPSPFAAGIRNKSHYEQSVSQQLGSYHQLGNSPGQTQTFNNCARGWNTGSKRNTFCSTKVSSTVSNSLPYSDF